MRMILLPVCLMLLLADDAKAIECQTSAQNGNVHWSWRLIEGRQCWYAGPTGMDKSLLHWPAADRSSSNLETTKEKPDVAQAVPEMRPIPPEALQMLPIFPPQPTFEDRWRLQ